MLYTGLGDAGYTSVIGAHLSKCDVRVEALGALDEAQAHLGLARALLADSPWTRCLIRVQEELRLLMAECATTARGDGAALYLMPEHLAALEHDLARWDGVLGGFQAFVTPGDSLPGAHLHLARTVIRRAERQVVALHQHGGVRNAAVLTYLNRLSSWLFALALVIEVPEESRRHC